MARIKYGLRCEICGCPIIESDRFCPSCGRNVNGWIIPTKDQCGNCHAELNGDKYCRICGTKAGEGAYEPYQDLMECIYGPMPVNRKHVCTNCGYSWTTCFMVDDQKYCPKCGGSAPYEEDEDFLI